MLHYTCYITHATFTMLHYTSYIHHATLYKLHSPCYIIHATLSLLFSQCYILLAIFYILHCPFYIINATFSTFPIHSVVCVVCCCFVFQVPLGTRSAVTAVFFVSVPYNRSSWERADMFALSVDVLESDAQQWQRLTAVKDGITFVFLCPVSCRLAELDGGHGRHAGSSRESSADPNERGSWLWAQSGSCKDVPSDEYNPTECVAVTRRASAAPELIKPFNNC